MADVVARALGGNSGLLAARQRLQKAQELIAQVNAQARPQIRADATDVYSSYNAFPPTLATPAIQNPTLPGGGQIPVVVDQGNGFSTTFVGGGGGGNAPSSGETSPGVTAPIGGSTPGVGTSPVPGITPLPTPNSPGAGGAGIVPPGTAAPANLGTANPGTTPPVQPGTVVPGNGGTITPGNPPGAAPPAPANGNGSTGTAGPGLGEIPGFIMPTLPPITQAYAVNTPVTPERTASRAAAESPQDVKPRPADSGAGGGNDAGSPVTATTASRAVGQRNDYAARLSVSQYIDLFGLLSAARDAQKDVRDFYALDIERLGNETALAAKNLFFNVLLAQAGVDTQEEQVRYTQENVRITESRLRQGIVSRFDVLTAQTALSTAQQQLIAAQDQRDLAQADLSFLLGTDPDQPIALLPPPLPDLDQTVNIGQSTQVAQANRPEVRQVAADLREARRLVKLAGSPLLPTLGLVAYADQTNIASVTTPRSYANIGAQIAVPLDDGGATRSRVRSAQVDVQTQLLTLEQIKLSVALEVRQASLNIRNAQAQVGAAQTGVTQAQEAVRLAQERYQAGLGTFLDVLNALAQLARTRDNLASAQFFYQTSLAQLVRAMGSR